MKNIPNILTIIRIILIPVVVWLVIIDNRELAGIVLIVSSITDFLDGFLARKFNWITNLGKLLDPIADKFTQGAVAIILIKLYKEYWYFFAFIILKDFVILLLGLILLKQGMVFSGSKIIGKVSTFYLYLLSIALIIFSNIPNIFVIIIISLAGLLALISGLSYIPEYKRYKSEINNISDKITP